jgi:hypothetical protein
LLTILVVVTVEVSEEAVGAGEAVTAGLPVAVADLLAAGEAAAGG